MTARQRRFWWAAGLLGTLAAGVTIAYLWVTQSQSGRQWVLATLVETIDGGFKGRGHLRVGALREIGWNRLVLDSVSIVDTAGVAVLHIEHATGDLDIEALFSRVIHVRSLDVDGLRLDLHKDAIGPWNIAYIISGPPSTKPKGPPGFGDDIRIDALRISRGAITTIAPWAPHPIFVGSARDSVIAVRDSLHDLIRTPATIFERRRIAIDRVVSHDGIIMRPDRKPSSLVLDSLRGQISDPAVRITGAAGTLQWTPDSLRLTLPTVALPASTGSANGVVWWHQPGAVRYDVSINTRAGLSDLTWIWDVLPATGGGTATVRMRTLESADDAQYDLSALDVSSMGSHITGKISVIAKPAQLLLTGVDLTFAPLRADLMRRLSYEALPPEVQGTFEGRLVAAAGGPLTNFLIDRLDARFNDATIPGAVSSLRAAGRVTMGSAPAAQRLVVQAFDADLRSVRALAPTLPPLDGRMTGRGTIVAADLKIADLNDLVLVWTDAEGNRSSVTGSARIGYGLSVPTVKADLLLDPISMRAFARLDTTLAIRSTYAGRVTADGTLDSLDWRANLTADSSGRVVLDGTASLQRATWRATAAGTLADVDTRHWLGRDDVPVTALSGTLALAGAGTRDTAGAFFVSAARGTIALRQTEAAERPAFDLVASALLDSTRLRVDSATMHLGGVTLEATGALARNASATATAAISDTMTVSATADTLDLVRRQLTRLAATIQPLDSASAASLRSFAADTIRGDASVSGYLVGSLDDFDATLALGARDVQVGAIRAGRIFGSLRAVNVLTRASFEGVATADAIDGIGAARIASTEFRVQQASPDSGQLTLDASSANDAHLVLRGAYRRADGATAVTVDSLRFAYDSVVWRSAAPIRVISDQNGLRVDSMEVRSSANGLVALRADVPETGDVKAMARLERFPVGEAIAFALGTRRFSGQLTGDISLAGTRASPLIAWRIEGDSLGVDGTYLPQVISDGRYSDRQLVAQANITDSLGGRLHAEARVPVDLSIATIEKRLLSDKVDADVSADSLNLEALDITVAGVSRVKGSLVGRVSVAGTVDRPVATGRMTLDDFSFYSSQLGIAPDQGRALIRAAQDSLILESFRVRSGRNADSLGASGVLRFARDEAIKVDAKIVANNAVLARQRDGTNVVVSGGLDVTGELKHPSVSGAIYVPAATILINPLGASTALDLTSETARAYLLPSEIPVLESAGRAMSGLGALATVSNLRVDLGNEVWVRTPEAAVKLSGSVALATKGNELVPEGEISANRGQYRLDLGVVSRSFSIDSGKVRFFGDPALEPTLDIKATNVVRLTTGDEIPVGVHIGGTIERPLLTLSSSDPLYSSAPESEIISLLIFGAPTFALDGQSQNTVRAVTGVLLPSLGGAVEGYLQRLLPVFNTVQITTAGGQTADELTNAGSLINNLAISAGKQIGERTFLRLNTGVCRGGAQQAARGSTLWAGVAAEYRLARGLSVQMGVDPGSAPCSRLGTDLFPRLQFGFDLFREWIF
jgi:translocation and assembly module TamB